MPFAAAARALAATVKAVVGTPITYRRQPYAASLSAVKARHDYNLEGQPQVSERVELLDWLIQASDLRINGVLTLPKRGDVIEHVENGKTYRYEAMAPIGDVAYRWCDRFHVQLRVHTTLVRVT